MKSESAYMSTVVRWDKVKPNYDAFPIVRSAHVFDFVRSNVDRHVLKRIKDNKLA